MRVDGRLAAAGVLVAAAGLLAWAVTLAPQHPPSAGAFPVYVVGPAGLLANGTVTLPAADALSALRALGDAAGFAVDVEDQPWVGDGCTRHYVRGIAGHRETATGGWNYYVRSGGGDWAWQPVGAACRGLQLGEELEWCWVESDVCRAHVP